MKTSERILVTSLLLFNEEGEPNVTTVDISNEMEISPGNLYYHFKGKEAIIEALFNRFETDLSDILRAPLDKTLGVEDSWFYLYVVFEEIYNFRFFYQNLTDLLHRYDPINRKFKRLMELKTRTSRALLDEVVAHCFLVIEEEELVQIKGQLIRSYVKEKDEDLDGLLLENIFEYPVETLKHLNQLEIERKSQVIMHLANDKQSEGFTPTSKNSIIGHAKNRSQNFSDRGARLWQNRKIKADYDT